MLTETRLRERGHRFYPPAGQLAAIPALYATEAVDLADKLLYLHYLVKDCDWWIAELDPHTGLAFGYACLGDPANAEWGYADLTELEALYQPGQLQTDSRGRPVRFLPRLIAGRDLHWTPTQAADAQLSGWRATGS